MTVEKEWSFLIRYHCFCVFWMKYSTRPSYDCAIFSFCDTPPEEIFCFILGNNRSRPLTHPPEKKANSDNKSRQKNEATFKHRYMIRIFSGEQQRFSNLIQIFLQVFRHPLQLQKVITHDFSRVNFS